MQIEIETEDDAIRSIALHEMFYVSARQNSVEKGTGGCDVWFHQNMRTYPTYLPMSKDESLYIESGNIFMLCLNTDTGTVLPSFETR